MRLKLGASVTVEMAPSHAYENTAIGAIFAWQKSPSTSTPHTHTHKHTVTSKGHFFCVCVSLYLCGCGVFEFVVVCIKFIIRTYQNGITSVSSLPCLFLWHILYVSLGSWFVVAGLLCKHIYIQEVDQLFKSNHNDSESMTDMKMVMPFLIMWQVHLYFLALRVVPVKDLHRHSI